MKSPFLLIISFTLSMGAMEDGGGKSHRDACILCKCITNHDECASSKKQEHATCQQFQVKTSNMFPHFSVLMRYDQQTEQYEDISPQELCIERALPIHGFKHEAFSYFEKINTIASCSEHPNQLLLCMSRCLFKERWEKGKKLQFGIDLQEKYCVLYNWRTKKHTQIDAPL